MRLIPLVHQELHRIARRCMAGEHVKVSPATVMGDWRLREGVAEARDAQAIART